MDDATLQKWFENQEKIYADTYLLHTEPWKQSGFSGPEERWTEGRKPIANCIDTSGSFLDLGCANGYLLECVMKWNKARGLTTVPYGLDVSNGLIKLAESRIPEFKSHLFVGNAWTWIPPLKFDYVRTELAYVPDYLHVNFINRLLNNFLTDDGRLLVAEYRSKNASNDEIWIDERLTNWEFDVNFIQSGYWKGQELTRIAVLSMGQIPG